MLKHISMDKSMFPTVECIEYLFKYYKGHDSDMIGYKDETKKMQYDEIQEYII